MQANEIIIKIWWCTGKLAHTKWESEKIRTCPGLNLGPLVRPANKRRGDQSPSGPDFFALSFSVCQFASASSYKLILKFVSSSTRNKLHGEVDVKAPLIILNMFNWFLINTQGVK